MGSGASTPKGSAKKPTNIASRPSVSVSGGERRTTLVSTESKNLALRFNAIWDGAGNYLNLLFFYVFTYISR